MTLIPTPLAKPWEPISTKIGFRFEGGIADIGQLNFYEAGRYRYAAARALYTLEHFRTTGNVIERLTKQVNADFRISAPSEGSFLEEVYYNAAPFLADAQTIQAYLHIPFAKILPWIFDKIIPSSTTNKRVADIANKLADVLSEQILSTERITTEREITVRHQAEQETERLRVVARLAEAANKQGNELQENNSAAKKVVEIASRLVNVPSDNTDPDSDPAFIVSELSAENNRANAIRDYDAILDRIAGDQEQLLIEQMRKTLKDIGYPLKRSSSLFKLEVGNDNLPIVSLNETRLKQITSVKREDARIKLIGGIIRLDKDFGFGRFRPSGTRTSLPFSIPKEIYQRNKGAFIRAFGANEIEIEAYPYRDGIGNITKLMLVRLSA